MSDHPIKDDVSGVDTTGHEWDGIRELNNPLPKWWIYTFYACIAWAAVYWVVMPAWPYFWDGAWHHTKGVIGYTQRNEVGNELKLVAAGRAEVMKQIAAMPLQDIVKNDNLMEVALAGGKAAFGDNCAPCHGSGAQGSKGFPNLNDDDWLWGGTLSDIETTVTHGIRWETDADTRENMMPRFLDDSILKSDEVNDVAEYVLSLSGHSTDAAAAGRGGAVFAKNCVACHGADGKGNQKLGAPNLTDQIWLYGGDKATVVETISHGRGGVMPAWGGRLAPATIKELVLYVHSLGGGQ
ncbi:MAG: cytochrome-c oxidase, cbb3-type subunit III [Parvibaculum sp.]|uniref:cytochrome-c oxidase, cbb3-type subunit III n=1 Tax=Parvibaculum sp. TaxID=2024848 RepID=UPI002846B9DC|nr:cytochrome-c oxidase, cbb3-type subunit III [Parvibaculum sp.]MDR3500168.1 cytochrome-c oxidase, cbb3-type subunit III [Parvibaculum sp.]